MKTVKQMLRQLALKKSDSWRAYNDLFYFTFGIPVCIFIVYSFTIICFWQNFTDLVPLTAKIPQNCNNVRTTPNCPWPNYALETPTFRTLLSTYLWQTQHDEQFVPSILLGVFVHIQIWVTISALLKQSQSGHSPSILPALNGHSSCVNISLYFNLKCLYV